MTIDVLMSGRTPYNIDQSGFPIYFKHEIVDISVLDKKYKRGDSYPSLQLVGTDSSIKSDNEYNSFNIKTLNYLFNGDKSLLYDVYDIPFDNLGLDRLKNAAMVPVDNGYLCIYPYLFFWLDYSFKLDVIKSNSLFKFTFSRGAAEEDHRLLRLPNGDILSVYTAILDTRYSAANKAGIRFLKRNNFPKGDFNYSISEQILLYKDDIMTNLQSGFEKNWSPFNYKQNQIFFIQSFQPFTVYRLDQPNSRNSKNLVYTYNPPRFEPLSYKAQSVDLVSKVDCPAFTSYFGKIRGGTPALLVRGEYLAFYHTYEPGHGHLSTILPDNHFYYFIGAYTFTTDPPFKVTSFSRFPISHETFIPGIYKVGKQQALITFAVSYILINKDGGVILEGQDEDDHHTTTVVLTIGVRDSHTIVAKINLNELLDSLKPIVC